MKLTKIVSCISSKRNSGHLTGRRFKSSCTTSSGRYSLTCQTTFTEQLGVSTLETCRHNYTRLLMKATGKTELADRSVSHVIKRTLSLHTSTLLITRRKKETTLVLLFQ